MIRYVLRPGWVTGITWLIVLLACPWLPSEWQIAVIISAALVLAVSLCVPALRHIHAIPLIAAVCLLATVTYHTAYKREVQPLEMCVGQTVSLRVQVIESDRSVLLEVQDGDLPSGTRAVFYSNDPELVLDKYDEFTADFVLEPSGNNSRLSELMRLAGGTWLRVKSVKTQQIEDTLTRGEIPWTDVFIRVRDRLSAEIEQRLDGDIGAAVAGICYGADEHLSDPTVSNFRSCGVSHLLAVSGLHMTVLLQGLMYLLYRLRVKRTVRPLFGIVFLFAFMAIVGFSASVVRAGVMSLIVLFGNCLRRRADARNSLGISLLVLLIPAPFAAYDAGLLLSCSATFGLLCWTEPIRQFLLGDRERKRFVRIRKAIAATVAVSLAAMFATLPVLALYFGRISLVSVPVNFLTALPAEVVLIAGCLASLFSVLGLTVLAQPLLMLAGLMSRYLLWICENFSTFSLATVATPSGFLLLWMVGVYLLFWIGRRFLGKSGTTALVGACVCILCVGILLNRGATYNALRVGNASDENNLAVVVSYRGGTVVVTAPDRASCLYDIGDTLYAFGASRIDALFVIGGKEPAVSYVPVVLADYWTDDTQVLDSTMFGQHRVTLGECLQVGWQEDGLFMNWNGHTLRFSTSGETGTGIWVDTDLGSVPLSADTHFITCKNGNWYIAE